MTSRRVTLTAAAVIVVIFASAIAQNLLFDVGGIKPQTDSFGPVQLTSAPLDLQRHQVSVSAEWAGEMNAAEYDWKDSDTQELLHPLHVVVLSSDASQRDWLRAGSACAFIERYFETGDGLMHVPGFDALTLKDMHICMCKATADQRQWFYACSIPDPRCRTNALVFWKVPWTLADGAPGAGEINSRLDGGIKAKAMNAIRADLVPDGACVDGVHAFARGLVIASLAGVVSVLALLIVLVRRSAG